MRTGLLSPERPRLPARVWRGVKSAVPSAALLALLWALATGSAPCQGVLPESRDAGGPSDAGDEPVEQGREESREQAEELEEDALGDEIFEWDTREEQAVERLGVPRYLRENWTVEWKNGLRLGRNDGAYELLVSGRLLLDVGRYHVGSGITLADDDGWFSDHDVRQAQLFAQGILFGRLLFKAAYDQGDAEFRDVYVGLREVPYVGFLRLGYMKEPFSLEQQVSRRSLTFMERSLANALVPKRNMGILINNLAFDDRLAWSFGVFNVEESFQESDDLTSGLDDDFHLTARVTGLPIYREEGSELLQLGLSYTHEFIDDQKLQLASRPESNFLDKLLVAPEISNARGADRLGLESVLMGGPLAFQGELIGVRIRRGEGAPNVTFWGGYAQLSYFLTGERRVYGRRSGTFGRVVPKQRFSWRRRQWGAWQLAVRTSYLDLSHEDVRGGQELNVSLALNWHLTSQLQMAFDYVYGHVMGQGDLNIFQIRLQLDL